MMNPPFEFNGFGEMSKQQAKEHFDWYVNEIPKRIELLKKFINESEIGIEIKFDFTPQSLECIWWWYIEHVEVYNKTMKESECELEKFNLLMKKTVKENEIPVKWLAVAIDISIYFAECMLKNNDNLKWDVVYSPKSFMWVNRLVIVGFKQDLQMNPENLIYVQTRKILRGQRKKDALIELFYNWQKQ